MTKMITPMAVLATVLMGWAPAHAETTLEKAKAASSVKMAFTNEVPFSYSDKGNLTGADTEVVRAVLSRISAFETEDATEGWRARGGFGGSSIMRALTAIVPPWRATRQAAAMTPISTLKSGVANGVPTVARAGAAPCGIQASHLAFISAK